MRFKDASGRKVVSTSTADTVGKIDAFVVDVSGPKVVALQLKKTDSGDILRWADINAFGGDAVTVESDAAVVEADGDLAPLLEKSNHVLGKLVLSKVGDELGKVADVEFDAASGAVTALVLDHGAEVSGKRMVGIGSYAVVVEAE